MLTAETLAGERVEASRDLAPAPARCPACRTDVVFKRGRVKVPHFAHAAGSSCEAACESLRHLQAKRVLADQFRALGYGVRLEEAHPDLARRVDLAATVTVGDRTWRVAVEVQDSPISVDEMKRRGGVDRRLGFIGTAWVFTGRRHDLLLPADVGQERRPPEEMRWLNNRYGHGVFLLDAPAASMWHVRFGRVVRPGDSREWYSPEGELEGVDYPDRYLKATKTVHPERTGFRLSCVASRYHKPERHDWCLIFVASAP